MSSFYSQINRSRLTVGCPCISEASKLTAAENSSCRKVERSWSGPWLPRPEGHQWELPPVILACEPAVDGPLKGGGEPSQRRDIESALGVAKIKGGAEWPDRMQREI